MDVVDDIIPTKLLAADYRVTYVGCIKAGKMMIKHHGVPYFFVELCKDAPVAKILCVTHDDEARLYISAEVDVLLINRATIVAVKKAQVLLF